MRHSSVLSILVLLPALACDPSPDNSGTSGSTTTANPTTGEGDETSTSAPGTSTTSSESGDGESSGGSEETGDDPPDGPLLWEQGAGPCGGSITNALWFDDRNTGFIGCGENANGEGLYTSVDGGVTWEDNVRFREVRIMDIRRGPDGVLYGSGIHQLDDYPVWSFDESGATINSDGLYTASNNAFLAVNQAENIAVTADGQMLIDSLTGTTAAYKPAGAEFEEVSSLSEDLLGDPDALGYQVRRIKVHDNRFFAVGSLINNPARVHLPSQLDGATYHFHTIELQPETRDGELMDLHVWDPQSIIVVGFDQSERFPLIYRVDGADPYVADNWEKIELLDSGLEYEGAIRGLSVSGDTVVAVGEKVPTAQGGFIVMSEDRGVTWTDITPTDLGSVGVLSRVVLFDNGEMVVAGGGGELLMYTAS